VRFSLANIRVVIYYKDMENSKMKTQKRYEIFVADDNGWLDGCQDSCETFFGSHNTKDGEWTYTMDGGFLTVAGYRNARRVLRELNTTGKWIAPEEVMESRPVYDIRESQ
jgi:hypothetical protein